jgi:hypothetical protein
MEEFNMVNDILPDNMSEEELQYHRLTAKFLKATSDSERDLAMTKIRQFSKKHPVLVDEIQSRRWLIS